MAGIHQFTSSQWIQSGSTAIFESGLIVSNSMFVSGTISATSFTGDGSGLTGLDRTIFFAGSSSGVSSSDPYPISEDHVVQLYSAEMMANPNHIQIHTTSSDWSPNYYNFVKVTNTFKTIQSGSSDLFIPTNESGEEFNINPLENSLAPGVHRYLVYAAKTGSGGKTERAFTTVTINPFINYIPVIINPTSSSPGSSPVIQMNHDEITGSFIAHFTNSYDPNESEGDFIRVFSASRTTEDVTNPFSTTPAYDFRMSHPFNNWIINSDNLIATASIHTASNLEFGKSALPLSKNALLFSASLQDYDVVGTDSKVKLVGNTTENFNIRMSDNNSYQEVGHSPTDGPASSSFSIIVKPPTYAELSNIRTEFENNAFTLNPTNDYTTTILYDDIVTRTSTSSLHDRYTASLARMRVLSKIIEPAGYSPEETHYSTIAIYSGSNADMNHEDAFFKFFRFKGNENTSSMVGDEDIRHHIPYTTTADDSSGFIAFPFSATDSYWFYGCAVNRLDDVRFIRHGNYNHYQAFSTDIANVSKLKINSVPNIQISNVFVEVESGSFLSNVIETQRTSSILYGHTTTLTPNQTSSLLGRSKSNQYISESVVRLRLRAKVTEPFGPHHTKLKASIADTTNEYKHDFYFYTGSGILNCSSSASSYDSQDRLVSDYTSSWISFNLSPSSYVFSSSFESDTNTGRAVDTPTYSNVLIKDTPKTIIENLELETETYGESNIGITSPGILDVPQRQILYGETTTRGTGSGLADIYTGSAVTRFRILTDVIEPFGPLHHSSSIFYKKYDMSIPTYTFSYGDGATIQFSTSSTDVFYSQSSYDAHNRLVANYTSSWITESLESNNIPPISPGPKSMHLLSTVYPTSLTHNPPGENGYETNGGNASLYIEVSASNNISIDEMTIETEKYPYSSSIGTSSRVEEILYGHDRTLSASDANSIGDIWTGSAAIRTRVLTKITEPLGMGHFKTQISMSSGDKIRGYEFYTASQETASSTRVLSADNLYVSTYTSSWHDGFTFSEGSFTFSPSAKTGSNTTGVFLDTSDGLISSSTANAVVTINSVPTTSIKNIKVEVEASNSGSATGATTRGTQILYGKSVTETNHTTNKDYSNASSRNQLTSVRLLADIEEPFGPHHTSSKFTISGEGYNDTHFVTLVTGSSDISSSILRHYSTHGSQSNSYTSSFVAIEMTAGTRNISASIISHSTGDRSLSAQSQQSTITVTSPSEATVTTSPQTSSLDSDWSSSIDLSKYVTYDTPGINTIDAKIVSGISATPPTNTSIANLVFPTHLEIDYRESPFVADWGFSPTDGNSAGQETSSIIINESNYLNLYDRVKEFTGTIKGIATPLGGGVSSINPFTFNVVPAKPRTMHDQYWSSDGESSHETSNIDFGNSGISLPQISGVNRILYSGTLPAGLLNYKIGDSAGTTVQNLIATRKTYGSSATTNHYSMSFSTLNNFSSDASTGYSQNNTAFNFGDSGSLVVKINGSEVVNASLQAEFDPSRKHTTQDLTTYDANGWTEDGVAIFSSPYSGKGKLKLIKVAPYNNVSQSISAGGIDYPNGYQAWEASIQLDSKLRDGYNFIEFSHSFDDGTSQDMKKFEWYYDDGNHRPRLDMSGEPTLSLSYTNPIPTSSLSGVSFILQGNDTSFLTSFNDRICGLADDTWRTTTSQYHYMFKTQQGDSEINFASGSDNMNSDSNVYHSLNSIADAHGIIFDNVPNSYPSASSTASIVNLTTTLPDNFNNGTDTKGKVLSIKFSPYYRNYNGGVNSFTTTGSTEIPVGRFLDTGSFIPSTKEHEKFTNEDYRWSRTKMTDESFITSNRGNYNYFIYTSNADYNSNQSILATNDLQVCHPNSNGSGSLEYPTLDYVNYDGIKYKVVHPNQIDYQSATTTGHRYLYRAFYVGTTATAQNFRTIVEFDPSNPLSLSDIYADPLVPEQFDSKPIRIDFRLPGPINQSQEGNTGSYPGTAWGYITGGSGGGSHPKFENWNSSLGAPTTVNNSHRFMHSLWQCQSDLTDGIVLMRIRFKNSAVASTHKITGLKIEAV